jgi:hypothetical protein
MLKRLSLLKTRGDSLATAVWIFAIALSACSPGSSTDGQSAKVQGPATMTHSTAAQWQAVVGGVFDKVNAQKLHDKKRPEYVLDEGKTDDNGITNFRACFDKAPPQCKVTASGKRDEFRKIQFLSDLLWDWKDSGYQYTKGIGEPSVRGYISLPDCRRPMFVLKPTFRASGWIFLEQFSLMVNGEVVLDRKFSNGNVDREVDHNSVTERAHITLDEHELQKIRNLDSSKQVHIRFTGQKGHVGLDSDASRTFVQGVSQLLPMYDALDSAIIKVGPVKDAACPS